MLVVPTTSKLIQITPSFPRKKSEATFFPQINSVHRARLWSMVELQSSLWLSVFYEFTSLDKECTASEISYTHYMDWHRYRMNFLPAKEKEDCFFGGRA